MKKYALFALILFAGISEMMAQVPGTRIPPRKDDHFQRNLTVYRVDMDEKVNRPMVMAESPELYAEGDFGEKRGIVAALINGLKSGKYLAYNPDSLDKTMTYAQTQELAQRLNGSDQYEDEELFPDEDCDWCGEEEEDGYIDDEEGDVWPGSSNGGMADSDEIELAPFETVIEFISNRIFDKNRSDIVNDIQFIRLVWVDPGETLPDQNFICLKYSDVLDVLEDTQWKNVHNDAEYRNMREIFDLQIMNKYVTNVSGRGVRTLPESQYRTDKLTEFEHNLWSY